MYMYIWNLFCNLLFLVLTREVYLRFSFLFFSFYAVLRLLSCFTNIFFAVYLFKSHSYMQDMLYIYAVLYFCILFMPT